jgi:creatine kinase
MFKDMDADKYLKVAGISGDWPHGRGAYICDDGRISIWCNEEDHLRITCLCQTTLLNEPFQLLERAVTSLGGIEGVNFKRSDKFGFVTSCPSNLGTGMRASVMLCLPNLTTNTVGGEEKANAIAKGFGMQVRGSGGEHTPVKGNMVDCSPRARYGVSEAQILGRLSDGVKAILEAEKAAAEAAAAAPPFNPAFTVRFANTVPLLPACSLQATLHAPHHARAKRRLPQAP